MDPKSGPGIADRVQADVRVIGGSPPVGKDVDFVARIGHMGGVIGNEMFGASIVDVFLSDNGYFHACVSSVVSYEYFYKSPRLATGLRLAPP